MSQVIFDEIDPSISGTDLAGVLNDFKDAIVSGLCGTTRPTELAAGGWWVDTTNDPTSWSFKIWTGTDDIEVFTLNLSDAISAVDLAVEEFSIKKVSADTAGAILNLVKQRASGGQVLSGDVVGEIRFVGRDNAANNPVVGYLKWAATDNMTTSAFGGTLSLWSTPDGESVATEHFRLINGLFETVVPQKLNSLRLVGQNVATAATITQLDGDKVLVEMTGSTATDIQGIDAAGASQVVTIHNRSSAEVTLKHQNGTASAVDRMKLPNSDDYVIPVDGTATLYYCTAESLWKLLSTSDKNFAGFTTDTFYGAYGTWTAPSGVSEVQVKSYRKFSGTSNYQSGFIDYFGAAYAWGDNSNGRLGVGDVNARSSPVAVLGGLTFLRNFGNQLNGFNMGLAANGSLYAWGTNGNGQLGLGDVTVRSSPVAVLGGFKFNTVVLGDTSAWGITTGHMAYAWGLNTNGQLGVGDVTPRSSPVAVLNSLKIAKIHAIAQGSNNSTVVALTTAGAAYAWGANAVGELGVGDLTVRSSPVAVLGSLTFTDIGGGYDSGASFTALDTSGAAYAWGDNTKGQLGVGDVAHRSSPVAVVGGLTFSQIITQRKSNSVFGITTDGDLYGWGANDQGQLGVGDTTARSSPVAVLGGLTFKKVRMLKKTVYGLTEDGTLYAWGSNSVGQLGNGDVVSRSSPVAVLGGFKFFDVVANDSGNTYHILGIQGDGALYAWGANAAGDLGLGDVVGRSSPVAVLGGLRIDTREEATSVDLTVTPSASYTVSLNAGVATFGNTPLGFGGIYKVQVEYMQ